MQASFLEEQQSSDLLQEIYIEALDNRALLSLDSCSASSKRETAALRRAGVCLGPVVFFQKLWKEKSGIS